MGGCQTPPAHLEHPMKTKLLIITLLATLLGGCIVVPAHPYAYRPAARVYVY
jgi:hypothetical protein